jgi:polygalacturonase
MPEGSTPETRGHFPDGTPIGPWYAHTRPFVLDTLGRQFVLTKHGVRRDSTLVQTAAIQRVIDRAAEAAATEGRAVVVVPRGTFLSGALFLRQGVSLWLEKGGTLKGSDDIADFPIRMTRIEGQTCPYFAALINADSITGLRIGGHGTINGNGLRYWRAFWLRREWNPACTNKDEQRPRLLYVEDCADVEVSGLSLKDSPFWTTHFYRSHHIKLLQLRITSPAEPVKAPSTDAIDIDACQDVHVSGCYMAVNDDAVALKGGKGPWADTDPNNGANERIVIEDCEYGFCHGCLTLGSENIHSRNIVLRRIRVAHGARLLWLKMRPDTPQHYEYISVEDVEGEVDHFLFIRPWTQFFDLQGRTDMPVSVAEHVSMRRCKVKCREFFNVGANPDQYRLSHFTFQDLTIQARNPQLDTRVVEDMTVENCDIRTP